MSLDEAIELFAQRERDILKRKKREREEDMAALSRLLDALGVPR